MFWPAPSSRIWGVVRSRSGACHARTRYNPPRIPVSIQVPSAPAATVLDPTASPTRRSTRTVAPATTPDGPVTMPESEAVPGVNRTGGGGALGTGVRLTPLRSVTTVVAGAPGDGTVDAGVGMFRLATP